MRRRPGKFIRAILNPKAVERYLLSGILSDQKYYYGIFDVEVEIAGYNGDYIYSVTFMIISLPSRICASAETWYTWKKDCYCGYDMSIIYPGERNE